MSSFFPHLPIRIPNSPGLPTWWDVFFWVFQIVIMTSLVSYFNRLAERIDIHRVRGGDDKEEPPGKRSV